MKTKYIWEVSTILKEEIDKNMSVQDFEQFTSYRKCLQYITDNPTHEDCQYDIQLLRIDDDDVGAINPDHLKEVEECFSNGWPVPKRFYKEIEEENATN